MNKCPECGRETVTDYDLNEEPYELCINEDCGWYDEGERDQLGKVIEDET